MRMVDDVFGFFFLCLPRSLVNGTGWGFFFSFFDVCTP